MGDEVIFGQNGGDLRPRELKSLAKVNYVEVLGLLAAYGGFDEGRGKGG